VNKVKLGKYDKEIVVKSGKLSRKSGKIGTFTYLVLTLHPSVTKQLNTQKHDDKTTKIENCYTK